MIIKKNPDTVTRIDNFIIHQKKIISLLKTNKYILFNKKVGVKKNKDKKELAIEVDCMEKTKYY